MKKALSVLLCLAMLLSVLPMGVISVSAVTIGTYDKLIYEISNSKVTITDCNESASGALTIPSKIDGYPVTSIGDDAFYMCYSLTSVTIGNSVTSIGEYAFCNCSGLTSITIGNSVTSIGEYAFAYCNSLTSVTIGNSVTSIGEYAFYGCDSVTSVAVGSKNTAYTSVDGVLFNKAKTTLIQYPAGKTATSYTIPSSVTSIGDEAFYSCYSLTSITVDSNNTKYASVDGVLFNKAKTTLIQYPAGKTATSYTIPSSVTSIGDEAFYSCYSLTSITIPNSVTSIGWYAFYSCYDLTSITIPNSVTSIGRYAFCNCSGLTSITIGNSVASIGGWAFSDCDSLTTVWYTGSQTSQSNISIEGSNKSLKDAVWHYVDGNCDATCNVCGKTRTVSETHTYTNSCDTTCNVCSTTRTIAHTYSNTCDTTCNVCAATRTITHTYSTDYDTRCNVCSATRSLSSKTGKTGVLSYRIDPNEDGGTVAITACDQNATGTVEVPSTIKGCSVVAVEADAFVDCEYLTGIEIPNSVTRIANGVFEGCKGLFSLELPFINVYIGTLFGGGTQYSNTINSVLPRSLKKITINTGSIPSYAFTNSDSISTVILGSKVTDVGERAFYDCNSLTSVTIGKKVKTIGEFAFANCVSLTTATVGDGVTDIQTSAFQACYSLVNLTLGKSIQTIGSSAFAQCESLEKVTIPDSTQVLGSSAFYGCKGITTISVGDSVTTIFDYVFYSCESLKSIILPNSVASIGEYSFADCKALTRAIIKGRIEHIDNGMFSGCAALTTVAFPKNVDTIAYRAFYGCTRLNKVWFEGSKTQRNNMTIASGNDAVKQASWSYGVFNTKDHIYDNACDKSCNLCGETRTIKHSYKAATCTKPKTCKVCGKTSGEKLGHDYETKTTKATLKKNGKVVKQCAVCDKVSSTKTIYYAKSFKLSTTEYTYNGKTKTPSVTVKDSKGNTLKKDTDYTVTYASGRKNAGTYKVTVKMKGNYTGTKTLTFKIKPIDVSKCSLKLSTTTYTYNGDAKKPSVTVKNASGTKLTKDTDYTVSYASGRKNVGTYKVTVKMKGNYTGTKTLTFKINPPKTSLSSLTAGSKKLTVKWSKKSTQVTGYQIQYSTSKKFTSAKTKTISSYKTTSATLKSLKAKKTYYVRVRTYKTVDGKKYYSDWSTYKYKKTK